jgi:predicted Zn-dependent protease
MQFLMALFALSVLISSGDVQAHTGDHRTLVELDAIIKENPDEPSLLVARGALYSRSGQWEKAERDLSLAEVLGNKGDVAFEFGQFHYRRGEYQKALAYIDTYIGAHPSHSAAFLLRARAASAAEQFHIASESYQAYFSLAANPQPGEYLAAARLLAGSAPTGVASGLAILDEGISKLGLNPQLQRYAIALELRLNDTEDALDRWYRLKDQLGGTPEWGIALARLLILDGKIDEARLALQAAKERLVRLRQTPARKLAGENISRLERQLSELPTKGQTDSRESRV